MSTNSIGGKKRENTGGDFEKKVGLFEANVIAVNPTIEQYSSLLGIELDEKSKAAEYLGERDGNTTLRIDFWLEAVTKKLEEEKPYRAKVSFFLENKIRTNKDETKNQYINEIGICSWAEDVNDLPEWFSSREYREAYVGEEDLYNFMRTWLSELDYRSAETTLNLEWKKLMKGNVKDIKEQLDGEWCGTLVALSTVVTKEKEGEVKEYSNIYNRAFLPSYALKNFRLVDYSDQNVLDRLNKKASRDLKPHERFVLNVTGDYGCKDFYVLSDLKPYDSSENLAASESTHDGYSDEDGEDGDY